MFGALGLGILLISADPAGAEFHDALALSLAREAELSEQNRRSEALNADVIRRDAEVVARNDAARADYEAALARHQAAMAARAVALADWEIQTQAYRQARAEWEAQAAACRSRGGSRCGSP